KKFTDIEFRYYQKQNIYIIYLDKEANIDSLDARGKKLYGFLNSIDNENFNINELSNREIIEKTISALEPLNSYKIIMVETIVDIIQKTFNLGYKDIKIYANKININNEKLCKAYKATNKFKHIKIKTEKFFKNLIDKTQIISLDFCENKIIYNNDNKNINDYILNFEYQKIENRLKELNTNEIFNIEDELEKAFLLYLNFQFDESYLAFKKLSNRAFKEKNYRIWYICKFNKKHFYPTLSIDDYENKVKIYERIDAQRKKINLNELAMLLPKSYRTTIKPIKDYQDNFHKLLNQMYELELKAIQEKELFKNGGSSINNNLNQAYRKMNEQYNFIMQNMLTIIYLENIRNFFGSFCKIYFTYLSIQVFCLNRNEPHILKPKYAEMDKDNKIINFNKYSIFALSIFSMKREDIIKIMREFDGFKFKLYNDDKKLSDSILLRIFNNIIAKIDKNSKFSSFVNNFLILLAHFQIEKETFAQIIKLMTEKLKKRYFSWNEYKSLNYFILHQYNKNKCFDDEELFKFINSFINNFVCDKINYHDREAMSSLPIFGNIFSILPKNKFSNSTLVSNFLNILQEYDKDFQSQVIPNFIIGLYLISTNEIKEKLENYISKFIKDNEFSIDILGTYYLMYANNILNISFDDMKKYIAKAREKFQEEEETIAVIEKYVMNIFKEREIKNN
ncbi:MAG: hypothetical protein IJM31_08830, partial [Campylobacter sp.]|nr:hypothetical protein [Campylobacter sp.]